MSSSEPSDSPVGSPEIVLRRPQQSPNPVVAHAASLRSSNEAPKRAREPQSAMQALSANAQEHDGLPVAISGSSTPLRRTGGACASPLRGVSDAQASPSPVGSPEIVLMRPAAANSQTAASTSSSARVVAPAPTDVRKRNDEAQSGDPFGAEESLESSAGRLIYGDDAEDTKRKRQKKSVADLSADERRARRAADKKNAAAARQRVGEKAEAARQRLLAKLSQGSSSSCKPEMSEQARGWNKRKRQATRTKECRSLKDAVKTVKALATGEEELAHLLGKVLGHSSMAGVRSKMPCYIEPNEREAARNAILLQQQQKTLVMAARSGDGKKRARVADDRLFISYSKTLLPTHSSVLPGDSKGPGPTDLNSHPLHPVHSALINHRRSFINSVLVASSGSPLTDIQAATKPGGKMESKDELTPVGMPSLRSRASSLGLPAGSGWRLMKQAGDHRHLLLQGVAAWTMVKARKGHLKVTEELRPHSSIDTLQMYPQ